MMLEEPNLQALASHHVLREAPQNLHIEMRGPYMTVPSTEIFLLHRVNKQTSMQRSSMVCTFSLFKNRSSYLIYPWFLKVLIITIQTTSLLA